MRSFDVFLKCGEYMVYVSHIRNVKLVNFPLDIARRQGWRYF
jgi:hypothetical protein